MKLRAIALAAFAALALSACDRGADSSATASRDATAQPSKGGNLSGGLGSKQDGTAAMGASPAASAAAGSGSTNRTPKSSVGQR
jgi:hypothetical protein